MLCCRFGNCIGIENTGSPQGEPGAGGFRTQEGTSRCSITLSAARGIVLDLTGQADELVELEVLDEDVDVEVILGLERDGMDELLEVLLEVLLDVEDVVLEEDVELEVLLDDEDVVLEEDVELERAQFPSAPHTAPTPG